ncbi:MAG: NHLP leader peptide family RiPP precursor [Verrucomicrobiales bacterium]|nr:NHLP leader peptide family RiPP precursor [Verrucomicrobiae bacterium]
MATEALTRADIEEIVVNNATKHPKYREILLEDPKKTVETQLNNTLPDNIAVEVVQESPTKIYIRLPYIVREGDELSDEDLEQVAGGKDDTYSCNESIGGFNTRNEFSASVF